MFSLGRNTHIPLAGLEVVCQYNTVTPAAESRCWLKWALCDAQTTGLQRLEETMGLNDYTVTVALGSFGVCRGTKNTKLPITMERREEDAGYLPRWNFCLDQLLEKFYTLTVLLLSSLASLLKSLRLVRDLSYSTVFGVCQADGTAAGFGRSSFPNVCSQGWGFQIALYIYRCTHKCDSELCS